ncbi:DUF1028 domain-containing protein [Stappia sp. ES.058]|uniref:DUF1028 domain-containing protein n=1 Tax=Stappia sp. ES.058 TaxID=1881061 RepID=UPI00087DB92B|nr:DUF1028 domain-containing protein [Stappia sp. ES.058]SDU31842.1 Uncharacterized conserved protein, Ntn-hydrolase superfamily [Stappia sp. ES.058]
MTYSIVARDPGTGAFGVAVASRFFAVGALVPHMDGRAGAIATQAFVSPLYGTDGLDMLKRGDDAQTVMETVTGRDAGRHSRQMHVIDAQGRNAAFTGEDCVDWAGHLVAENVSVAGNMLAGPQVLDATLAAYQDRPDLDFAERLLCAMEAGEAAGGDKRGRQSAALRITRGEAYPWLDIRADDHGNPLAELRRLIAVAGERFLHVAETLPTADNLSGLLDRSPVDEKITRLEMERKAQGRASASFATPPA